MDAVVVTCDYIDDILRLVVVRYHQLVLWVNPSGWMHRQ